VADSGAGRVKLKLPVAAITMILSNLLTLRRPRLDFVPPPGVVEYRLCETTAMPVTSGCREVVLLWLG
jgi:hypothetical protein